MARLLKKSYLTNEKELELEHSENGPWDFLGTTRRPGKFPGCYFRSFGAKKLLVSMWGLKWNPLYLYLYMYILKYGGPPADGGHPGGRRAGGHPGGRRTGGGYTTDGHTFLRYGGREDTEGAPTRRQGRFISSCAWRESGKPVPSAFLAIIEVLCTSHFLPLKRSIMYNTVLVPAHTQITVRGAGTRTYTDNSTGCRCCVQRTV